MTPTRCPNPDCEDGYIRGTKRTVGCAVCVDLRDWTPPETFAQVLGKLPPERQALIRAKLAEQQEVMREFIAEHGGEDTDYNRALRDWTAAYYDAEERWVAAQDRIAELESQEPCTLSEMIDMLDRIATLERQLAESEARYAALREQVRQYVENLLPKPKPQTGETDHAR